MATLTVPYSFNPNTAIIASEMNSNFGAVKTFVEALAAGTNIDTGVITSEKLATSTIQLLTPTGSITQYAGSAAPTGWMFCDGDAISRTTYSALFAVIGTTFGSGDGTTTFNVPNLKGRVPVGRDATQTEFDALAETGGSKTHTLTSAEMPSHSHTADGDLTAASSLGNHSHTANGNLYANTAGSHSHVINISDPGHGHNLDYSGTQKGTGASISQVGPLGSAAEFPVDGNFTGITASANADGSHTHDIEGSTSDTNLAHGHDITGSTSSTGGGGAHNNLQPYLVLNYIIKI